MLAGTYQALVHRNFKIVQPLTAGWDSRVLLAASKRFKSSILYYVFDHQNNSEKNQDVRVPLKLAETLDLNFQAYRAQKLDPEFIENFKSNHIHPRILPKTKNIQFHYLKNTGAENVINVNGNGAEIVRCFFGNHKGKPENAHILFGVP